MRTPKFKVTRRSVLNAACERWCQTGNRFYRKGREVSAVDAVTFASICLGQMELVFQDRVTASKPKSKSRIDQIAIAIAQPSSPNGYPVRTPVAYVDKKRPVPVEAKIPRKKPQTTKCDDMVACSSDNRSSSSPNTTIVAMQGLRKPCSSANRSSSSSSSATMATKALRNPCYYDNRSSSASITTNMATKALQKPCYSDSTTIMARKGLRNPCSA
jgi:hypothetical protein